jgi:hypothetical protein
MLTLDGSGRAKVSGPAAAVRELAFMKTADSVSSRSKQEKDMRES